VFQSELAAEKAKEQQIEQQKITNRNANIVNSFKEASCKTIASESFSSIDVKGLRTGDLCKAPESILEDIALHAAGKESGIYSKEVSNDEFYINPLIYIVDKSQNKIYVAKYTQLICAGNVNNNLETGNSFRSALEAKYGKVSDVFTFKQLLGSEASNSKDPMVRNAINGEMGKMIAQIVWNHPKGQEPGSKFLASLIVTDTKFTGGSRHYAMKNCKVQQTFTFEGTGTSYVGKVLQKQLNAEQSKRDNAPPPKF
jgi:hypothetical protein